MIPYKQSQMKINLSFFILIIGFAVGFFIRGYYDNYSHTISQDNTKTQVNFKPNEILASYGENRVVISADKIMINEGFDSPNPLQVELTASNYPDLFQPGTEFDRIHVSEINIPNNPKVKLLHLARQRPDHGSIEDGYYVDVDPEIGKVVASGWTNFFGSVRIYSSCTSCALPLLEYRSYDQSKGSFVLENTQHIQDFVKLKQDLIAINKREICKINGKQMTLEEAVKTADDSDKCADGVLGSENDKPADSFITIGDYRGIFQNIDRIINGENIPVFSRL